MKKVTLAAKKCLPCEVGAPPLTRKELENLSAAVPDWLIGTDGKKLVRNYTFKNFKAALNFIDVVGAIAESEGHHPDLHLENYKHVRIELFTHATDGLSENDFILAAKIDELSTA